jgi:hypothetical protein
MSWELKTPGSQHDAKSLASKSPPEVNQLQPYSLSVFKHFVHNVVGNSEYVELSGMDAESRKVFVEQYNELAAQVLNIRINDKISVMFNVNDPIFKLANKVNAEDLEELEEWSRCGCCGDPSKKLKHC